MLLADMGADVIKIEPPGGEATRGMDLELAPGVSAPFLAVNRNKRGIVLDLKRPEGVAILKRLVATADVLVENYRPGVAKRLGVDYETLSAINPRLIYCSISGFGQTGPYAERGGYDLIAQGMSGIMSVTGEPGGPPVKVGVPITDLGAGLLACIGVLAALRHRQQTGQGQWVDTSLLDAGLALSVWEASGYLASGIRPEPMGSAHRLVAPYQAFPTRDGYVNVGAANQSQWERLCEALGLESLGRDPRFEDNAARMRHRVALAGAIADQTRRYATADLVATLDRAGIPCGPILGYDAILEDQHARDREMVVPQEHPVAGSIRVLGVPIKFSATPAGVRRAAPLLGQDTAAVLRTLGYGDERIADLAAQGICATVSGARDSADTAR
jgi:formyl-CoA transferase